MKLWNIFNKTNRGQPFISHIPLGPKMTSIVQELHELSQFLHTDLSTLIQLYRISKTTI